MNTIAKLSFHKDCNVQYANVTYLGMYSDSYEGKSSVFLNGGEDLVLSADVES